jgi:hypothetical protein
MNSPSPNFLDTSIPNTARIFDYFLGGSANFEADRETAHQLEQLIPSLGKFTRLRRAFVQEAAQILFEEGFRQFLDLGSGMPTQDHIHAMVPEARVVYSDINPVAVHYGMTLLADIAHVRYIYGNARELETILESTAVKDLINLNEKLAIGLNAIFLFLQPDDIKKITQTLYDWAPAGSQLYVTLQTRAPGEITEAFEQIRAILAGAGMPMQLYTLAENMDMLKPWTILRRELATEFLSLPDNFITPEEQGGIDLTLYATFLGKM